MGLVKRFSILCVCKSSHIFMNTVAEKIMPSSDLPLHRSNQLVVSGFCCDPFFCRKTRWGPSLTRTCRSL